MRDALCFPIRMTAVCLSFLVLFGGLSACNDDDDDYVDNRPYTVSGNADGSQMVPAVTGTGTGTITGTYNPSTRVMTYTSGWTGLTGVPTAGGFYSGAAGSSGTAVGTPFTFASGSTETGTLDGTMTLTSEQASDMIGGNWYYSFGTATNPGGEVRGQITATRAAP